MFGTPKLRSSVFLDRCCMISFCGAVFPVINLEISVPFISEIFLLCGPIINSNYIRLILVGIYCKLMFTSMILD